MDKKGKIIDISEKLDPKMDIVFKNLFGKKGNEDLLEDLLSGILDRDVECKVVVREGRVGELTANGKYGSLDLMTFLTTGEEVDLDMQTLKQKALPERMVTYASYLTAENLEKQDNYTKLKKKLIIFMVDYNMYPDLDSAVHETAVVFKENREKEFTELHKYYIVELGKMDKVKGNKRLYKWLAFLNQDKEALKEVGKDKYIEKAEEELKYLAGDPETRRIIQLKKRYILEMNAAKEYAYDSGIEQGTEQAAIKMIEKEMSINTIAEITGLSKEKIKELKDRLVRV